MDDDKCGKFGSVKFEGRECASSLGSVKCTERPGISPRVQVRKYTGVGKFAHLAKDCGPTKRSLGVN